MKNIQKDGIVWARTHFQDGPEQRLGEDRRKVNCFISQDRRSGIFCRRRERVREIERRIALSKVTFYPDYYPIR